MFSFLITTIGIWTLPLFATPLNSSTICSENSSIAIDREQGFLNKYKRLNFDTEKCKVAEQLLHRAPAECLQFSIHGVKYIIAFYTDLEDSPADSEIFIIHKEDKLWKVAKQINLQDGKYASNFKVVKIEGAHYLYYENLIPGGSMNNADVHLGLVKIDTGESTYLHFSGHFSHEGQVDGEIFNSEVQATANPKIWEYLVNQLTVSELIYQPTAEDKDIFHPKNAIKKFLIDNPTFQSDFDETPTDWIELLAYKYKNEPYFSVLHNGDDYGFGSITSQLENENYLLFALFKNFVICFDKLKNEHYLIWVPTSDAQWINELEFITPQQVRLVHDRQYGPVYEVDLDGLKMRRIL